MATSQTGFCGNCGNSRVLNGIVCPYCAQPYESTTGHPSGSFPSVTQGTPPTGVPTYSGGMPGVAPPPIANSGIVTPTRVASTPIPPVYPPQSLPPVSPKPRNTAILVLSILVAILFLSTAALASALISQKQSASSPSPLSQEPTATSKTKVPTNTPAATATSTPQPKVLCNVDIGTWTGGSADWKVLNGVLLNAGNGSDGQNGPTKVAPCQLGDVANYAVEATIQVTQIVNGDYGGYGIEVRGTTTPDGWQGYDACVGFGGRCNGGAALTAIGGNTSTSGAFTPGTEVHTYRVEVKDNKLRFLIDGAQVVTLTDNEFLTGSQVGLWCVAVQLSVFSFQVTAL